MLVRFTAQLPDEVLVVFNPNLDTSTTIILQREELWDVANQVPATSVTTLLEAILELTIDDEESN